VSASKANRGDAGFVATVELRTVRADGRETLNARAQAVLATTFPAAPAVSLEADDSGDQDHGLTPEGAYRDRLFHGPELHGIERVEACDESGIAAHSSAAPPPAEWIRNPLRQQWLTDPLVIDVGFQLMTLWTIERRGAASLPCFLSRYRQYRRSFPDNGVRVRARVLHAADLTARADLDFIDAEGRVVARIEGCECAIDPALRRAFERRVLVNR
jgi:hypothetical protein